MIHYKCPHYGTQYRNIGKRCHAIYKQAIVRICHLYILTAEKNFQLKYHNMSKNKYIPRPINTGDIVLPEEQNPLAEKFAKNVHEV